MKLTTTNRAKSVDAHVPRLKSSLSVSQQYDTEKRGKQGSISGLKIGKYTILTMHTSLYSVCWSAILCIGKLLGKGGFAK